MMKTATALIQCMMRSGRGCSRAGLAFTSGIRDFTARVDIEQTSAGVLAARAEREAFPPLAAHYGDGDSGASTVGSQNRAGLSIEEIINENQIEGFQHCVRSDVCRHACFGKPDHVPRAMLKALN